jgi:sterol desaturase/sphingolipid hydroxylase (fatty acid hydroxylase superfamily)
MSANYSFVRAGLFFGLLALFLFAQQLWPRRGTPMLRAMRWPANFGLLAIDTAILSLLPVAAITSSIWAQARGYGLLNQTTWPGWLEVPLAWVALDCAIYWQHRWLHEIGWLWPLHRVHHSDVELDATTGVRFHPAEIVLSMLYKCAVVVALGAPWLAVLLFETALNGLSLFNHANLRLNPGLDRILRRLIVTPDMHRTHHSIHRVEHDSNYSNAFAWWDRLFASYTDAPRDGHETMQIGLEQFRVAPEQRIVPLLSQPLR